MEQLQVFFSEILVIMIHMMDFEKTAVANPQPQWMHLPFCLLRSLATGEVRRGLRPIRATQ